MRLQSKRPPGTQDAAGLPTREWRGADPVITTRVYTEGSGAPLTFSLPRQWDGSTPGRVIRNCPYSWRPEGLSVCDAACGISHLTDADGRGWVSARGGCQAGDRGLILPRAASARSAAHQVIGHGIRVCQCQEVAAGHNVWLHAEAFVGDSSLEINRKEPVILSGEYPDWDPGPFSEVAH